MSINPATWGWKTITGWIVTALIVFFFWVPILNFLSAVIEKAKGLHP
jgi:uncharacterized protein YqfA (UPF0365 family)